jgi:hypothetical protein
MPGESAHLGESKIDVLSAPTLSQIFDWARCNALSDKAHYRGFIMTYAIADKAKMESAATVLHALIAEELTKGKNAKFPRAKVLQMLSKAMYSRSHEELLATVYATPSAPMLPEYNPVVIIHYGDVLTLIVDRDFADEARETEDDLNLSRLRSRALEFSVQYNTPVVHAYLPCIFEEDERTIRSLIDLATSMGYFSRAGSIFDQLENADLIHVNQMNCSSKPQPNWVEVVEEDYSDEANDQSPIWFIRCDSFSQFSGDSYDVTFDQLRRANPLDDTGTKWSIVVDEGEELVVELFFKK